MLTICIALLAIAGYLAAAGLLALPLTGRSDTPRSIMLTLAWIASLLHTVLLFGMHRGGLDLHFFAALSAVGFVIAIVTLLVNLSRPVAGLGVIVFPLAAALLAVDVFVAPPTSPSNLDWQIKLHVTFA
ncbi:MAG: inner membrane protein YpjD, partial [Dokdonella sp.]